MPKRRLTTELQDAAILKQDKSDKQLAAEWNHILTAKQIAHRRFHLRKQMRDRVPRHSVCCPHIPVIRRLLSEGKTLAQISDAIRVSKGAVQGFVYRNKLRQPIRF